MNATLIYNGQEVTFYDCNPDDCIERDLLAGNWYELPNLEFIRNLNIRGDYLDAGAYIGTHSIFFAMFCQSTMVYSIEPQTDINGKLCDNIVKNGANCYPIKVALSDHEGRACFRSGNTNRGGAALSAGDEVQIVELDSLNLQNIKLAKIDVENSELAVLRGGRQTLQTVEHLFIEQWSENTCKKYGIPYIGQKVIDLLKEYGFKYQRELWSDLHYWSRF